jgi:hypothetical protein
MLAMGVNPCCGTLNRLAVLRLNRPGCVRTMNQALAVRILGSSYLGADQKGEARGGFERCAVMCDRCQLLQWSSTLLHRRSTQTTNITTSLTRIAELAAPLAAAHILLQAALPVPSHLEWLQLKCVAYDGPPR